MILDQIFYLLKKEEIGKTLVKLFKKVKIGGVDFDGSTDIDLPGVNISGSENIEVSIATTARTVLNSVQSNITSVGALTELLVDDITIDGNLISSTNDKDLKITSSTNKDIVLNEAIKVESGGVITGATSVTSTSFTGDLSGNADTATTVINPEQSNITSVGTLTNIDVEDITIDGN